MTDLLPSVTDCVDRGGRFTPTNRTEILQTEEFGNLECATTQAMAPEISMTAFTTAKTQEESEERDVETLSGLVANDEDIGDDAKDVMLCDLPGRPRNAAATWQEWINIPRTARVAICRLHAQFGHCENKQPVIEILRSTSCPEKYVQAAKFFAM